MWRTAGVPGGTAYAMTAADPFAEIWQMKVLVTGGTGVVGKAAVDRLLEHGHTVRLFSRNADHDARQWSAGVEPYAGNVGDEASVRGAADGCDAVLHVAGIVQESPPDVTFRNVNVEGTRRMVHEARRAGASRFVYVSSLGAERGSSDYHRSKKEAEDVVQAEFPGDWLVLRPGNVYGPGDEVISTLLTMVRTLPAVPVVGGGEQPFQPIWAEDLGEAIARAVEGAVPGRQVLELAGPETTSMSDLLDLLEKFTQRNPVRIPVPEWLARSGVDVAESLGVPLPVNSDQLTMLVEENVIRPGRVNALTEVFRIEPTRLAEGLAKLTDALPERLPDEGVGALHRQRYWADIRGSRCSAQELFDLVRTEFHTLPPSGLLEVGAEPGTQQRALEEGETLTLAIPLRGNIQVRVEEIAGMAITAVTLEGHPLSGAIRFMVEDHGETIRFEIRSYTRRSNLIDQIGMATVGNLAQRATWQGVVTEVVRRSGGEAVDGVKSEQGTLDDDDARKVEKWIDDVVMRFRRKRDAEEKAGKSE